MCILCADYVLLIQLKDKDFFKIKMSQYQNAFVLCRESFNQLNYLIGLYYFVLVA